MIQKSEILISKMAVAQRQLDAAIRMIFLGEDELAIYTLAAAAHRVLRDIMSKRARSAGAEAVRDGIRGMANALVQGTLPDHHRKELEGEPIWQAISALAEQIQRGEGDALVVDGDPSIDKTFWNRQNEVANFLKHADRDSHTSISQEKINIGSLLISACMTYGQLMGKLTIEMQVYGAFRSIDDAHGPALPERIVSMCSGLQKLPPNKRLKACLQLISTLKKAEPRRRSTPRSS
jgi:hypothetical protein